MKIRILAYIFSIAVTLIVALVVWFIQGQPKLEPGGETFAVTLALLAIWRSINDDLLKEED